MSKELTGLLIALADDELVLGHRHSEWTGWAPHIEEDVAFSSIAQDEIGHAAAYYKLASDITGETPDAIAFGRKPAAYRHALICERPNGDWGYTLARHWLYDHADDLRLESLEASGYAELANLATKIRREERYHLIHADLWLKKIARGPVEGRTKLVAGLTEAYGDTPGLFEAVENEDVLLKQGLISVGSTELQTRFIERTVAALDDLGLPSGLAPDVDHSAEFVASSSGDLIEGEGTGAKSSGSDGLGGRSGDHTPDFEELWDVMTVRHREEPEATW